MRHNEKSETTSRPEGAVYFLRAGNSSFVKIGWSTQLKRRIAELQSANSQTLTLLMAIAGQSGLERKLHHRFAKNRSRGEWFKLDDDLKDFIEAAGGPRLLRDRWKGTPTDDDVRSAIEAGIKHKDAA